MNKLVSKTKIPWALSFSYGRALQASAINAWKGEKASVVKGQAAFLLEQKLILLLKLENLLRKEDLVKVYM